MDPQHFVSEENEHQDDLRLRSTGLLGPNRWASLNLSSTNLHLLKAESFAIMNVVDGSGCR